MKFSIRSFLLVLCVVCMNACGPVYDTRYTFTPPRSDIGRNCVYQCENSKMQCQQLDQMRQEQCEQRARAEQDRCKWDKEYRGEKERWYDCTLDSCDTDDERCDSLYRNCYQSCGGDVRAETVCVMNCAQAAPPPPYGEPR